MADIDELLEIQERHRPAGNPIFKRYSQAYTAASAMLGFATFVKVVAIIAGAAIAIGALVIASDRDFLSHIAAFFGIGLGISVAGGGWWFGVLIAAQAQIMKACLDTAVSTSVLASTEEKVELLSRT